MSYKLTEEQCEIVVNNGAQALFGYCRVNGIHYLVTGVSGGLDSGITLGIAQRACQMAGEEGYDLTSVGLILPCESSPDAERLGDMAIEKFNAHKIRVNLTDIFNSIDVHRELVDMQIINLLQKTAVGLFPDWDWSREIAQGNIKARLRMMLGTYHVARMLKGVVLSTDNISEYWMGFWTICGDVGDFGLIQKVLKGLELYDIARYLDVPEEIIKTTPTDGLGITESDEEQLGASYVTLDQVMIQLIQRGFDTEGSLKQLDNLPVVEGIDPDLVYKLAERCLKSSFKRKGTINLSRHELGLPQITEIKL
jgi:NAD+ synthetase